MQRPFLALVLLAALLGVALARRGTSPRGGDPSSAAISDTGPTVRLSGREPVVASVEYATDDASLRLLPSPGSTLDGLQVNLRGQVAGHVPDGTVFVDGIQVPLRGDKFEVTRVFARAGEHVIQVRFGEQRRTATYTLLDRHGESVHVACNDLYSAEEAVVHSALERLDRVGDLRASVHLVWLVDHHPDGVIRGSAARLIASWRSVDGVPALIAALRQARLAWYVAHALLSHATGWAVDEMSLVPPGASFESLHALEQWLGEPEQVRRFADLWEDAFRVQGEDLRQQLGQ